MTILAKPIVKDSFWILEEDGEKQGILQQGEAGVTLTYKSQSERFNKLKQAKDKYNITFETQTVNNKKTLSNNIEYSIHGYTTKHQPFNSMFDVKRKLPLFTKADKSTSYYCAGYYIIRFDHGWAQAYCPKLITLSRYEFQGPFKTEFEMKEQLRLAKSD